MTTHATHLHQTPDGRRWPDLHTHAADLEACLDFINSEELTDGIPEEHMPTVDVALAYFTERGLAHEDSLRAQAAREGDAWLRRLYATRAALRAAWDAQVGAVAPPDDALAEINRILRHAGAIELRPGLTGMAVGHRHAEDDPTGEALARVVRPLVDAIEAGDTARFRVCANDGCRWVFEDTSRAGRRRWCDMTTCGNRAKVRRFRSKRRGPTSDAGSTENTGPAEDAAPAAAGDER